MSEELKPLTKKQQVFVDEYLKCFNGAEAARRAGYSKQSARFTGSELLTYPNVSQQIRSRLNEVHMSADEALKLTADIARGDITELLTPLGSIDLDYIREKGLGRLIKKVKVRTVTKIGKGERDEDTEITDTELEMYSADTAQERVLKVKGQFKDTPTVNINMSWKDFVNSIDKE